MDATDNSYYSNPSHVADSPIGPFNAFNSKPHTPEDWMALDGTLYVENDVPYMIFCHEWVEVVNGSIDFVQLSTDLSKPVGKRSTMFHASDARWSTNKANKATMAVLCIRQQRGNC